MSNPVLRIGRGIVAASAVALVAASAARPADRPGVTWDEPVAVAAGGGQVGPWRMNESAWDYVDDPTVAISAQGVVAVAWADLARHDILFQVYGPDGEPRHDAPVNVSRSPRIFSWLPRLVIGAGDVPDVFVLWQEIVFSGGSHGGETLFARSTDGGRSFGAPVNLSNSRAGDGKGRLTRRYWHNGSLDLAMGPQGDLYAAWTEYEGTLWFRRSTDAGAGFAEALRIAVDGDHGPARGPAIAVDEAGAVHLAWAVGEDPAADIRFATSRDRGHSFGAPRVVGESGGHADAPKIAVDGTGSVHLVYAESPAGPFKRYHIRHTRLRHGAPGFEKPRRISRPHPGRSDGANFPALSLDGDGNIYVIWERFLGRRHRSQGLGFTHSRDGGQTFAPPSLVPGTANPTQGVNGSMQGLLMRKLAVNRSGALAVVNSTFKRDDSSRIWLIRGQAAGR